MEQQQEGERRTAFLADAPRAWYDDNGGLWAILAFGSWPAALFLREAQADAVCAGEIAALEEVLERPLTAQDVRCLGVRPAGEDWYHWCAPSEMGAILVTALPGDPLAPPAAAARA